MAGVGGLQADPGGAASGGLERCRAPPAVRGSGAGRQPCVAHRSAAGRGDAAGAGSGAALPGEGHLVRRTCPGVVVPGCRACQGRPRCRACGVRRRGDGSPRGLPAPGVSRGFDHQAARRSADGDEVGRGANRPGRLGSARAGGAVGARKRFFLPTAAGCAGVGGGASLCWSANPSRSTTYETSTRLAPWNSVAFASKRG